MAVYTKREETKDQILKALKNNGGMVRTYCKLAYMINTTQGGQLSIAIKELVSEGKVTVEREGRQDKILLVGEYQKPVNNQPVVIQTQPAITSHRVVHKTNNLEKTIIETLKNNGGIVNSYDELTKAVKRTYTGVYYAVQRLIEKGLAKADKGQGKSCIIILTEKGMKQENKVVSIQKPSETPKAIKVENHKSVNHHLIDEKLAEINIYISELVRVNQQIETERSKALAEKDDYKGKYERLLAEFSELTTKYHTAVAQLGGFSILQKDIILMAERLKAN